SNNEDGFRIEQSTDGVTFTPAATTGADVTTRSIMGLITQTTYYYRVRAFNGAGDSGYSNTANATTTLETIPTAPSGLTGNVASASGINLSWQDKSNNEQGFRIERCLGAGCVSLMQIAEVGPNTTTFSDTGLSTNSIYRYRVRAFNGAGNSSYSNSIERKTLEAAGAVLVRQGSVWKYLDNGSNQGTAWRETFFNDSAWSSGPAKLGYGDNDEATVVSYGPAAGNKYITTYFRHTFNVSNASLYEGLTLQLKRDDGAIVYLNGVEVWRVDMPTGNTTYTTPASVATDAQGFLELRAISASNLVNGTNVIAVEIHQIDRGSSDIALDLQLLGTGSAIVFNLQSPESHTVDDRTSLRESAMTSALYLNLNESTRDWDRFNHGEHGENFNLSSMRRSLPITKSPNLTVPAHLSPSSQTHHSVIPCPSSSIQVMACSTSGIMMTID
ncbi:MAG: fibronectin type III domain-containing protein, partial [Acidobacteria bacterium]|nr:fibronectin type III domain-containing protein [Acidobacteriota bacterium]